MSEQKFFLPSPDQHQIPVRHWPSDNPKAAVLILHGMAEHSARYQQFAQALNKSGYGAMAIDHRGHGSDTPVEKLGHFADHNGWDKVLADIGRAHQHLCNLYPQKPVYIFGHSMGSFITQAWLLNRPAPVRGVILSGSNFAPPLLLKAGRLVAHFESLRQGTNSHSKLIDTLSFGSYNSGLKPVRTPFDWLSRDTTEVDCYINDPCCGFLCSNQLWLDLFSGLISISSVKNLQNIDPRIPFYILGGSGDPVGQKGKGLQKLADTLTKAGIHDVSLDIWPQGRHEMLNETNRDEVTAKILAWLQRQEGEIYKSRDSKTEALGDQ